MMARGRKGERQQGWSDRGLLGPRGEDGDQEGRENMK